ncbi:glycosyl transferase [Bacteroidales bacterium SW299]|nr:glycosyl transferase [Bacteroidales bacterium SW299]
MIPKVIHYCWFGRSPLPKSARKCIASWKKFFPDYEIKEWNEDNFDVNIVPYTREAYSVGKYAFVSDYARFWILYQYGGLYFDTDVEMIKSMDDIVNMGPFMGCENRFNPNNKAVMDVASGLGIGAIPNMDIYKEILDYYSTLHFLNADKTRNETTVVKNTSKVLSQHGLSYTPYIQTVAGIRIYPQEYFSPFDHVTGRLRITQNTRSIHWCARTWIDNKNPVRTFVVRLIHRVFGVNSLVWLKKLIQRVK